MYIYLRDIGAGDAWTSVPLEEIASDEGERALHDLILDFDREGRLIGIEVLNPAALPPELVEQAEPI